MSDTLRDAYALIYEYKHGGVAPGSRITRPQRKLLAVLAADLGVFNDGANIEAVVPLLAEADTHWNKRTMSVVSELYDLRASGRVHDAEALRDAFVRDCPSHWYCGIVNRV